MVRQERREAVRRTVIVVGLVLGSSLAFYGSLVVALGVVQPLMLVVSDSMAPSIVAGDVVAIRSVDPLAEIQARNYPWYNFIPGVP